MLSVVIPVFNEHDTIDELLTRVQAVPLDKELVLVDDCSTDGTRERLAAWDGKPGVRVLRHERNQGKGAALRTGFAAVKGDYVIVQDGDLEYDPADYPALLQPLLDGKADVVFGSRFLGGGRHGFILTSYVANRFLTFLSNVVNGLSLTDMETCYKVFRADVLKRITITSDRFGVEPELTAKIAKLKVRVHEVPVRYHGRDYSSGKKIGWKDGLAAIGHIIRFRFMA